MRSNSDLPESVHSDSELPSDVIREQYEAYLSFDREEIHEHVEREDVVMGSLTNKIKFWREMGASAFIQKIILYGYSLPFVRLPEPCVHANHGSAKRNFEFVTHEVQSLRDRGCIKEVQRGECEVVSPLGVVDNGRKLRLIVDLRYVNKHLSPCKFKLEDLRVVASVYEKGDYMITFDLKSGYHHVAIADSYRRYLGFSWPDGSGRVRWYVFCVLPFGLSTAPYIFTKITRVLLRYWRKDGIRCQLYMDDGSGGHSTYEGAQSIAARMKQDLLKAGFLPNEKKSKWVPSQVVEMLGMEVDLKNGVIRASEGRVAKLKSFLWYLASVACPTARDLARLTGYLMSMSLAVGPVCRLRSRSFYRMIFSRTSWSTKIPWSQDAWEDVCFWKKAFDDLHGQPFWKKEPRVSVLTWSDASDSGWGGYSLSSKGTEVAKGEWPLDVLPSNMSSTWRELRAVYLVLNSLWRELEGGVCIHRSDNQAAVRIIEVGSRHAHLQEQAMAIHEVCTRHSIKIAAEWVPREKNQLADFYSKLVDMDDWQVEPSIFQLLDEKWGPHTLDCFASARTRQLERFCSRWWNPGCVAINAFSVDWSKERVWLVPPLHLIADVIDMINASSCHGTLIVPGWCSAAWWPRLHNGRDMVSKL